MDDFSVALILNVSGAAKRNQMSDGWNKLPVTPLRVTLMEKKHELAMRGQWFVYVRACVSCISA